MKTKYAFLPLVALALITGCASTARIDLAIYRSGDSLCVSAGISDSTYGVRIAPRTKCWGVFARDIADTTVIDTMQIVTGQ